MVVETVSFTDYLLRCHYFVFLFHLQCLKSNITVLVYWKYVIFYGLFFSHIVTYHIVSMFPFSQMSLVLHLQSNNGFVQLFYFSFDIRSGAYVRSLRENFLNVRKNMEPDQIFLSRADQHCDVF
jgi:hypothetical protein